MLYLDYNGIKWTKNHGIKIGYADGDETPRTYIPDFLVEDEVLVETKGWEGINFQEKFDAAMSYCDTNALVYEVVWHDEWICENKEWYEEARSMHDVGTRF